MNRCLLTIAAVCLLPVAAVARPSSPAFPATAGMTLHVVFDKPSSRPGIRLMTLTRTAKGWAGKLVSNWYGDMPMSRIVRTTWSSPDLISGSCSLSAFPMAVTSASALAHRMVARAA